MHATPPEAQAVSSPGVRLSMGWAPRRRAGYGQDLNAGFGNANGVLPLRGETVVFGHDGPPVGHLTNLSSTCVEHRLDCERHAGYQNFAGPWFSVVKNLWLLMKPLADPVTTKLSHDRKSPTLGMALDCVTYVT